MYVSQGLHIHIFSWLAEPQQTAWNIYEPTKAPRAQWSERKSRDHHLGRCSSGVDHAAVHTHTARLAQPPTFESHWSRSRSLSRLRMFTCGSDNARTPTPLRCGVVFVRASICCFWVCWCFALCISLEVVFSQLGDLGI